MQRTNNFDGLRLIGALSVIVGHAFFTLGRGESPGILGYPIATLGVVVFFSISGYLITASWTRNRSPVAYLSARVLRIFPALIVLVLLSVLVLGPWRTVSPVGDYFHAPRTVGYLSNIWMKPQYDLPGVFKDLPYPNTVNGSLWTLPAEFFCYLLVPVLCVWPKVVRPVLWLVFVGISLHYASVPPLESAIVYGSRISDVAGMWVFFAAGALIRLGVEQWGARVIRGDVAVGLVAAYCVLTAVVPTWLPWISWLALPYATLAIGLTSTPYLRRSARFGDLSYGIYLWGFPVQQLVIDTLGVKRLFVDLAVVTPIVVALAVLSWHLVEHPSLRLKDAILTRAHKRKAPRAALPPETANAETFSDRAPAAT